MLSKGFGPGFTGPLELVTVVPQNPDPALEKVVAAVAKQPGVDQSTPPTTQYIPNKTGDGYVALTTVYPTTSPQDAATTIRRTICGTPRCRRRSAIRAWTSSSPGQQPSTSTSRTC